MNSRRNFITDPGDRNWLDVSPRAAVAGGLVVVFLFGAMALLHPGERAAVEVDRAAQSFVTDAPVPSPQWTPSNPQAIPIDADALAAPDNHPPTF